MGVKASDLGVLITASRLVIRIERSRRTDAFLFLEECAVASSAGATV